MHKSSWCSHRFSIKGRVYPAILPVENRKVTGKVCMLQFILFFHLLLQSMSLKNDYLNNCFCCFHCFLGVSIARNACTHQEYVSTISLYHCGAWYFLLLWFSLFISTKESRLKISSLNCFLELLIPVHVWIMELGLQF